MIIIVVVLPTGQDLANFCAALWEASGNDPSDYNAFDVEMGESPHSEEEVNELLGDIETPELAYVDVGREARDATCGRRVVAGLVALLGNCCNVIVYQTDFEKLRLNAAAVKDFGFEQLSGGGLWYVRAATDDE